MFRSRTRAAGTSKRWRYARCTCAPFVGCPACWRSTADSPSGSQLIVADDVMATPRDASLAPDAWPRRRSEPNPVRLVRQRQARARPNTLSPCRLREGFMRAIRRSPPTRHLRVHRAGTATSSEGRAHGRAAPSACSSFLPFQVCVLSPTQTSSPRPCFAAARFAIRRSFSVFCAGFFPGFLGFCEPFIASSWLVVRGSCNEAGAKPGVAVGEEELRASAATVQGARAEPVSHTSSDVGSPRRRTSPAKYHPSSSKEGGDGEPGRSPARACRRAGQL